MSEEQVNQVSGHAVPVAAAQHLVVLNIDQASVMQAGQWMENHGNADAIRRNRPWGSRTFA
jgi:hypothetical protein